MFKSSRGNPSAFLFFWVGGTGLSHNFFENFFTLSKPFQTRAPYTYNEATTIAQTTTFMFNQ